MKTKLITLAAFAFIASAFIGCGSLPGGGEDKEAYAPSYTSPATPLDGVSPAKIELQGKPATIRFLGSAWVQSDETGAETFSGTLTFADNVATLTTTHTYKDTVNPITKKPLGWVKIPASVPAITLYYVPAANGAPAKVSAVKPL
jgi:hypothetical protein